ncbi:hypothetical protein LA080_015907 [Diaporthe eres]|nr:hypothetical protein LA080_015907 [Diaporthe eres]
MAPSIRIAIIGGGLAAASLIHALIKSPQLDVHIFEAAPQFKEAGMAIGIARNAQAALRLIGPSAEQCLDQVGAVPMKGVKFMLAQGEVGAGSMADEVDGKAQGKRLTSELLQTLLADIPEDRMHTSKKLQKIDQDNSLALYFTDGKNHDVSPKQRSLVPISMLTKSQLLCNQPEHEALYLWERPICITGDAAHSTTPWQGSGGGMSIEDSLILSTLLGRAKTPAEAITALKVYDQVRRPRTQRIVDSSRATGGKLIGVHELDQETSKSFMSRWDFIIDIDTEKHRDEAVQMMETGLKEKEII